MSALGSLVVKLGLEYAEFTGGLDKSEQAALAASKRVQDTFDGMKSKLAATAGAIAGGLAAGFTVSAFKSIIGGAIDTGAALDDLRMQTGATVESLSALMAVGKFNNMGPEQIGSAMNKLASNLAGATEESRGTGKAIETLGLDFEKFKQLRPEEQMQTVAKAMAEFEDGTGKSAVAMALYGKQGAAMIPFLSDLAEVGDLQAKVTTEQAAAAANLDDNLTRLSTSGEGWKKELANGMIPALDLGAQALVNMMNESGGLRDEVKKLSADGSIKQWTTDAIRGLSYVADVGQIAFRVLQSIGKGMGGLAAALVQALGGDFRGAWATLQASGQDMIDTFDSPTIGSRFRDSMDKVSAAAAAAGTAGDDARKKLDFTNVLAKTSKAATESKDPFDALRQTILKASAAYTAEAAAGEKLTEGQKKAVEVLDQLRSGKVKVTQAQSIQIGKDIEAMLAAEEENKAREKSIKVSQALADARAKETDGIRQWFEAQEQAAAQSLAAVQGRIDSLRDEESALAMSRTLNISLAEAVERLTIARLEEKQAGFYAGSEGWENIEREIAARKRLAAQLGTKDVREREERGWSDMWASVDGTAKSVFTNVFEGGSNVFKKLGQTLKASVLDVLYQMTVRKWMVSIGTSVLGAGFGAAANAATGGAAGGTSNLLSGASLLGKVGGSFGAGLGAGFGGLMGEAGLMGALDAGGIALGAGNIAGGLGTIAGALGPLVLAAGALYSIAKKFDTSGTYHTGAGAIYSQGSTQEGAGIYNQSNFGMGIAQEYNAAAQSQVSSIASSIGQSLDAVATAFGKKAGYEVATAFADDVSKDGAWGSLRISAAGKDLLNWQDTRSSKWAPKEFADGEAGQKQYLAAIANDTRQVLLDMDLPGWADTILNSLGELANMDSLAQAVQQIGAAQAIFASFAQYMPTFAGLADSAVSKLSQASGGVGMLATNMGVFVDGFYSDAEKLAVNTENVRAAIQAIGFEMPATREEFRAMLEAQIALGDGGADAAAGLLRVAGAFLQVTPAAQDAAPALQEVTGAIKGLQSETANLQIELLKAQGDMAGAAAAQRKLDTEGYGPAELAAYDLNAALRGQIAATNAATAAATQLAATNQSIQDQIDLLTGAQTERSLRLRDATDSTTKALLEQLFAQQDLAAAADIAPQLDAAAQSLNNLGNVLNRFGDTLNLRADVLKRGAATQGPTPTLALSESRGFNDPGVYFEKTLAQWIQDDAALIEGYVNDQNAVIERARARFAAAGSPGGAKGLEDYLREISQNVDTNAQATVVPRFKESLTKRAAQFESFFTDLGAFTKQLEINLGTSADSAIGATLQLGSIASYFGDLAKEITSIESLLKTTAGKAGVGFDATQFATEIATGAGAISAVITASILAKVPEALKNDPALEGVSTTILSILGSVGKDDVQGLNDGFLLLSGALTRGELTSAQYTTAIDYLTAAFKGAGDAAKDIAAKIDDSFSKATDAAYASLQRAVDAQRKVISTQLDAAQSLSSEVGSIFDTLQSSVKDLFGSVENAAQQSAVQARSFISNALIGARATGSLPDSTALKDAIQAATSGINSGQYASSAELDYERLVLANQLKGLKDIAGGQLTEAERQIKVLRDQLTALDSVLETARMQIDVMRGIDVSVLSVADAIAVMQVAIVNELGALAALATASKTIPERPYMPPGMPGMPTTAPPIFTGAGSSSGSSGTTIAGTNYASAGSAYGVDLFKLGDSVADEKTLQMLSKMQGFASGGDFAGGLRMVGERGWEIEATGPARIWNQQQLGQALGGGNSNAEVVAELRALRAEVAQLRAAANDGNDSARTTADVLLSVKNGSSLNMAPVPTF